MSDAGDIEELEKALRKRAWSWGAVIAIATIFGSAFGAGMAVQSFLNKVERITDDLKVQISAVDQKASKVQQALDCCTGARKVADETTARLDGHLRPDPKEPRR